MGSKTKTKGPESEGLPGSAVATNEESATVAEKQKKWDKKKAAAVEMKADDATVAQPTPETGKKSKKRKLDATADAPAENVTEKKKKSKKPATEADSGAGTVDEPKSKKARKEVDSEATQATEPTKKAGILKKIKSAEPPIADASGTGGGDGREGLPTGEGTDAKTKTPSKRRKKKSSKPRPKTKPTEAQKRKQRVNLRTKLLELDTAASKDAPSAEAEERAVSTSNTAAVENGTEPSSKLVAPPTAEKASDRKKRDAALEYLRLYVQNRSEWKFQKVRQVWILRNMWYSNQMDDKTFEMALEYVQNLGPRAREETVAEAKELVHLANPDSAIPKAGTKDGNKITFEESDDDDSSSDEEDASTEADSGSAKSSTSIILTRARKVIASLKLFL
ncbi:uncharacterized protein EV422DRAFT_525666 [Fimicolochytrium jonesii]|uniref:uncharacterized protein n=1 Tax=Fimicolochytrium jonesii TaxID=1396493 RepID=UPI0022FEF7D3|nr:uncharacterized protein EV422DRAFT_525666 [Fimicolochytrium jonesii]KAI8822103.1 hypothetical protein EV422DRAFT_525666 [Fimicolochytrium jonesii]